MQVGLQVAYPLPKTTSWLIGGLDGIAETPNRQHPVSADEAISARVSVRASDVNGRMSAVRMSVLTCFGPLGPLCAVVPEQADNLRQCGKLTVDVLSTGVIARTSKCADVCAGAQIYDDAARNSAHRSLVKTVT